MSDPSARPCALVVGVGPGLGAALARRFAKGGLAVAVVARRPERLAALAEEVGGRAYGCDAGDEAAVAALFRQIAGELGPLSLVAFNAGAFLRQPVAETTAAEFERCWRASAFGGFLVGREAARAMLPQAMHPGRRSTILFTGATAALRGGANFAAFAAGKFGLRAVAQSMARELGPQGVHVAHVIVDGQIGDAEEDAKLRPDAIAEAYWQLHQQPRSAWTHELDLRPWAERF